MFQTRETFFDDKVTSSEGAFTAAAEYVHAWLTVSAWAWTRGSAGNCIFASAASRRYVLAVDARDVTFSG